MRNYKLKNDPYDMTYGVNDTPIGWWSTIEDNYDYLQTLSLKLFYICPHSAASERVFSVLRWYYNQRRSRLHTQTVENLTKMHCYYVSNSKKTFNYYGEKMNEDDIRKACIEAFYDSNKLPDEIYEDNGENSYNDDSSDHEDVEIQDNRIYHQLNIEDVVNLDDPIFNDSILSSDRIVINNRNQFNIADLDYDIYQESSNFLQNNSDF
jgi:hypothetical protein